MSSLYEEDDESCRKYSTFLRCFFFNKKIRIQKIDGYFQIYELVYYYRLHLAFISAEETSTRLIDSIFNFQNDQFYIGVGACLLDEILDLTPNLK